MKKIVCLLGSPRLKSNSEIIARAITASAGELGATAEFFRLYKLNYSGCIACMGCKKTSDECVLRDDLTEVLRAVRAADILIVASPVYFAGLPGPLKSAIDRMYSFMNPTYLQGVDVSRLAPGKKCVFILTQGAPDEEAFADVFPPYEGFFGPHWFGYEMHLIRGVGLSVPGAAADDAALMEAAAKLGKQLME
ncbi:MAG: flavodoxin family protein [Bacteroidota bacterium]